jgi:hypothetical protein
MSLCSFVKLIIIKGEGYMGLFILWVFFQVNSLNSSLGMRMDSDDRFSGKFGKSSNGGDEGDSSDVLWFAP